MLVEKVFLPYDVSLPSHRCRNKCLCIRRHIYALEDLICLLVYIFIFLFFHIKIVCFIL